MKIGKALLGINDRSVYLQLGIGYIEVVYKYKKLQIEMKLTSVMSPIEPQTWTFCPCPSPSTLFWSKTKNIIKLVVSASFQTNVHSKVR